MMSKNSFMGIMAQKGGFVVFLIGKIIRFTMFFGFLYFLLKETDSLAGYTLNQTLFFFLTFNLIDVTAQFLFREVYRFRELVVSGSLDLVLTKPMSALFRALLGGADMIDLVTIPPLIIVTILVGQTLSPTLPSILLYILLLVNGIIIAAAFHIAVLALAIITLEIDHAVMIYRDMVALGRLPVDIYKEPLRGALTFIIPVALMITLPAKSLLNLADTQFIFAGLMVGAIAVFVALRFWKFALSKYSSASS